MNPKFLLFAAALMVLSCQPNESSTTNEEVTMEQEPSIVGAWEIEEYTVTTPDSTWKVDAPYRSVILYTKNYYSVEIARTERPSMAELPDGEKRSYEEISTNYNALTSNSGTYKIQGDSLIHTAVIAKNPNFMNDDPTYSVGVKIDGDKMTTTRGLRNNAEGTATTTYKRIE